jgi:hypothetical protein
MIDCRTHPWYITFVIFSPDLDVPIIRDFSYQNTHEAAVWLAEYIANEYQYRVLCDGRLEPGLPIHKAFTEKIIQSAINLSKNR